MSNIQSDKFILPDSLKVLSCNYHKLKSIFTATYWPMHEVLKEEIVKPS